MAQLGAALAAVLHQEQHEGAQRIEVRPVDDRAAIPFGADQAGARENAQVRRHGVLRHVELAGYLASREAVRFMSDQQAEHV
ncbi:hypothetical protein GCM10020258_59680 [Sphingomonas yabuuchiae]